MIFQMKYWYMNLYEWVSVMWSKKMHTKILLCWKLKKPMGQRRKGKGGKTEQLTLLIIVFRLAQEAEDKKDWEDTVGLATMKDYCPFLIFFLTPLQISPLASSLWTLFWFYHTSL